MRKSLNRGTTYENRWKRRIPPNRSKMKSDEFKSNAIQIKLNAIQIKSNAFKSNAIPIKFNPIQIKCNPNQIKCNPNQIKCNQNQIKSNQIKCNQNQIKSNPKSEIRNWNKMKTRVTVYWTCIKNSIYLIWRIFQQLSCEKNLSVYEYTRSKVSSAPDSLKSKTADTRSKILFTPGSLWTGDKAVVSWTRAKYLNYQGTCRRNIKLPSIDQSTFLIHNGTLKSMHLYIMISMFWKWLSSLVVFLQNDFCFSCFWNDGEYNRIKHLSYLQPFFIR